MIPKYYKQEEKRINIVISAPLNLSSEESEQGGPTIEMSAPSRLPAAAIDKVADSERYMKRYWQGIIYGLMP